jgi:CheY-like chemotaxis protein
LVVDDDPVVGKSFDRVLTEKGYHVVTAENAQAALAELRKEEYDLVYTDIRMPGMDGIEFAERVKARRPWTPVVIVTGYGSTENEQRARSVGVSAFLHKPLSPAMIEQSAASTIVEHEVPIEVAAESAAAPAAAPAPAESRIKNIALFFAAPFIGLAYAVFMPFVGLGMLAWMAGKAIRQRASMAGTLATLKNVGMFFAAPFIGAAYVVGLLVAGPFMLLWFGVKALTGRN